MNQRANSPGYFITLEGCEGSGKTSLLRELQTRLASDNLLLTITREPGGTQIGDQVRDVLHSHNNNIMVPQAELLGYMMSRAQNVGEVIQEKLREGRVILQDRFIDSSTAYQGFGHGLGAYTVDWLNNFATRGIVPDLTIFVDVDPKEGIERKRREAERKLGGEWNRMDALPLEFHSKVQYAYRTLYAHDETGRWEKVDGNQAFELVVEQSLKIVRSRLEKAGFIEGSRSVERTSFGVERQG